MVIQYICKLRGGSQPFLALASDQLRYVVKFANNLQGPNLPFNEAMGNELYTECGLSVPSWKALSVTDSFLDRNPDCWIQTPKGRLRPNSGLCFSSHFLGDDGKPLLEILPGTSFQRIRDPEAFWLAWLIDACAVHTDGRQAIFEEEADGWLVAYFVDHGHMFNGPYGNEHAKFQKSRYLDQRVYPRLSSLQLVSVRKIAGALDTDRLWRRLAALPNDWKIDSAIDQFAQCLNRLTTSSLVRNVLDTMADCQERAIESAGRKLQDRRIPTRSVLRLGVQCAGD